MYGGIKKNLALAALERRKTRTKKITRYKMQWGYGVQNTT